MDFIGVDGLHVPTQCSAATFSCVKVDRCRNINQFGRKIWPCNFPLVRVYMQFLELIGARHVGTGSLPLGFFSFFLLSHSIRASLRRRYAWCILQDRVLQDRVKAAFPLERGHHSIPDQMWFPYVMRIAQIHRPLGDTVRRVGMCPQRSDLPLLSKRSCRFVGRPADRLGPELDHPKKLINHFTKTRHPNKSVTLKTYPRKIFEGFLKNVSWWCCMTSRFCLFSLWNICIIPTQSLPSSGLRRLLERDGFASLQEACPVYCGFPVLSWCSG